jgi:hypothetical protein
MIQMILRVAKRQRFLEDLAAIRTGHQEYNHPQPSQEEQYGSRS